MAKEISYDILKKMIHEAFLGYIERKRTDNLYNNIEVPKTLIRAYFELSKENRNLDLMKENFFNHYIACESILEGNHEPEEKEGLKEMYKYINSEESDFMFDIFTLLEIHRKLYSKVPHPEFGGTFRNQDVYLPRTGINLSSYSNIYSEIKELDYKVAEIVNLGKEITELGDGLKGEKEKIFDYIDKCVELKCKLIKIHPFMDGNGRSVRGFLNKLFLNVGLPPVYIDLTENEEYREAMNKAISEENDDRAIKQFYYYKICDSIIELNISHQEYQESLSPTEIIMKIAADAKRRADKMEHADKDEIFAREVHEYLSEFGIHSQIFNTKFFEPTSESHFYVIASYKEERREQEKTLLIDPTFKEINYDELPLEYLEKRNFFINLDNIGITSITGQELGDYNELMCGIYQKPAPKPKVLTKKSAK